MLKTIKHRQGLKSRSTIMIHDCVCIDVMNVLNIGKCRIYRALGSISLIKLSPSCKHAYRVTY